jgi:citrate lyase subunit beta/citryl-CoA lyase
MLERALDFGADIVMVDLEDSVPPGEKSAARELAVEWAPRLTAAGRRVMVRVNSLDTGLTADELAAVVSPELAGISIGKGNTSWDLQQVDRLLAPLESSAGIAVGSIKVIPWIETAMAIVHVYEMAQASPRVVGIAFGAEDYTNDMGVIRSDFGEECYYARSVVAVAARAAGVAALDGPFVGFRDPDGLRKDAGAARQMGYTGKFAIHPAQIDIINETFSPHPDDVAYARRVVEAWAEAEAAGRGSLSIDGRMVDVPVVKRAQNLLDQVAAIASQAGA